MSVRFQLKRDTAADWAAINPVLALGEPGVETDTQKIKVGNGSTAWNSLGYSVTLDYAELNNTPTNISSFTNDSGYITDYTVTEQDVTQHQTALSITESQISDLQNYITAETVTAIAFNSSTNTLSYTDENSATTNIDLSLYLDDADLLDGENGTYYLDYNNFTNTPSVYASSDFNTDFGNKSTDDLSEGTTNLYYTDTRTRNAISASGDITYNAATGAISFTERTDSEVRGLFSAAGDLAYNATTGEFSVTASGGSSYDQDLNTTDSVTFDSVTLTAGATIAGDVSVGSNFTLGGGVSETTFSRKTDSPNLEHIITLVSSSGQAFNSGRTIVELTAPSGGTSSNLESTVAQRIGNAIFDTFHQEEGGNLDKFGVAYIRGTTDSIWKPWVFQTQDLFENDAVVRARIDTPSGYLGLGKVNIDQLTSVGQHLHVRDDSPKILIQGISADQFTGGALVFENSATSNKRGVSIGSFIRDSDGTNSYFAIDGLDSNGNYQKTLGSYDLSNDQWTLSTGNTPRLSIASTGNVGIGKPAPTSKLDVDGDVTATSFIGPLTGNATTATTLQTARTINGVSFDGSANITLPSTGGTTETTLTKSFAQGETASITLSAPISVAPVVSAIKEIPQVGVLSKSNWDVASNGANYDRHDTAYSADLSVDSITVSNLESTTYDNIVWDAGTDGSNDLNADSFNRDGAFNDDGTKFFRLDGFGALNQYLVSTAYDLSTTSYDNAAFDFNFQFSHDLASVAWSTNGSKLFGNDSGFGAVRQYSVPTAFDVSTVNDDSVSVITNSVGLEFDSAGSQFFVLDFTTMQSYSGFAGAFNISGAASGSSFDVTHPTDTNFSPINFVFSSDGSRLYISYQDEFNFDAVEILEVELTTEYDLTTASFTGKTLDITSTFNDGGNSGPTWLLLENSDTKLYVNENLSPNQIYQFTFGTDTTNEFSLSTGSFASTDVGKQIEGNGGVAVLLDTAGSFQEITAFNDNSTIPAGEWGMFALKFDSELGITVSGTSQEQSISNAVYDSVSLTFYNDTSTDAQSFVFNQDGTVVYFRDQSNIYSYNLSQPYDLSTAGSYTPVQQSTVLSNFSHSVMEFGAAGTKFYLSAGNTLYQFSLSTAYDLSPSSVDLTNQSTEDASFNAATDIKFVRFNTDGTKIFTQEGNILRQRSLSTAYDIDTISSSSEATYDFSNQDGITVHGGDFSQDGARLFVAGEDTFNATYDILEYNISTPFDLSTISYSGNSYNDTNLDFAFAPKIRLENNDSRLYVMIRSDSLYQYTANLFNFVQPINQYLPAVTNAGGEIDTTTWLDINAMAPDELPQAGEVYYAVSTDGRTEWRVIDNADGERIIARLNAGTWEYNSATTYTTDTFTAATTNQELYALQEALAIAANRMDKAQLEAVADANHYVLGDSLDLMIALYQATGALDTPSSDGVAINYDAETLNQGAVLGTDYDWDFPDSTTVRVTSNAVQNLKIRIL